MANSNPVDKRVRYFNGEFLQAEDFTDEQAYHLDRRRRRGRLLHAPGIAEGLEVSVKDGKVQVARGTALDSAGRQIVLAHPEEIDLSEHKGETVDFILFISYGEVDRVPATVGGEGDTRIWEKPQFSIEPTNGDGGNGIKLAKLSIDEAGNVTLPEDSKSVRVYAGLRLPCQENKKEKEDNDSKEPPTLRGGGDMQAELSGGLTVTEDVRIGTTSQQAEAKLEVTSGNSQIFLLSNETEEECLIQIIALGGNTSSIEFLSERKRQDGFRASIGIDDDGNLVINAANNIIFQIGGVMQEKWPKTSQK